MHEERDLKDAGKVTAVTDIEKKYFEGKAQNNIQVPEQQSRMHCSQTI